ncbi:MAG TPA: choice-of-anchor tandem repeat GloVer-containing protein [Dongiaceae bacterium]|nr:choice-of-anchor tandem repeat GloVer-containing protein [Dongiaceae bacterium]
MKLGIHLWVGVLLTASVMVCPGQQWQIQTLVNFATPPNSPHGGLVVGPDGNFYGTTYYGGDYNEGTFFRLTPSGTFTLLASFNGTNGAYPVGELASDANGVFYGMTLIGGTNNDGAVFKATTNGLVTCLASLDYASSGQNPTAGLTVGPDGYFYGTAQLGGTNFGGTLFKASPNGVLTVLASLSWVPATNASHPTGPLQFGKDGNIYGTTARGGYSYYLGELFRFVLNGNATNVSTFEADGGFTPGGLVLAGDNNFYGICRNGGTQYNGTIFRLTTNGLVQTLFTFDRTNNGAEPWCNLQAGADGRVYGTTTRGGSNDCGTVFAISTNGNFSVLAHLNAETGSFPLQSALLQTADGSVYGTTVRGGLNRGGTVFRLNTNGTLDVLVSFNGNSGAAPAAELAADAGGKLYGTTSSGGINGSGTIFSFATNGILETLFYFDVYGTGGYPSSGLLLGPDGNLYGVAETGGSYGSGVFYQLNPTGTYTELTPFGPSPLMSPSGTPILGTDGYFYGTCKRDIPDRPSAIYRLSPTSHLYSSFSISGDVAYAGLIQAKNGDIYGTAIPDNSGYGSIIKLNPVTVGLFATTVKTFAQTNGAAPYGSLVQTSDGYFYGTTRDGGDYNLGTVFKLSAAGVLTSLLSFDGTNGANPYAGLVVGTDGQLYGSTSAGGSFNCGTLYSLTTNGALTTLAAFDGTNGAAPYARLTPGGDGWLYGSTRHGGTGGGTLFRLVPRVTLSLGNPQPDGSRQLAGTGPAGYACRIWSSSDLSLPLDSWTLVTNTVCDETGNFGGKDPAAAINQIQFYRATIP